MDKDFDRWNNKKKTLDATKSRVYFHEREIWSCSLGINVGFEQNGKGKQFQRPILVVKKFNNEILWGISLTSKHKIGNYYHNFELSDGALNTAILSQLKLIDSKRLLYKIGTISEYHISEIKQRLRQFLI